MINRQGGFVKKIAIILADGVEETEFIAVGDVLRRLGMEVTVAGLHRLEVKGAHDFGLKVAGGVFPGRI